MTLTCHKCLTLNDYDLGRLLKGIIYWKGNNNYYMGHSTFLHIKKATCGLFVFFVFPKDVILKTTFNFPGFLLYPKVLEPRFNAELFAVLLSMPPSKTLLRRHLNTHFISLIGPETQTRKREHESQPGYIPLMPSNKIKVGKGSWEDTM